MTKCTNSFVIVRVSNSERYINGKKFTLETLPKTSFKTDRRMDI